MLVHNNFLLRRFGAVLLLALASFPAAAHQAESTQPVAINSTLVTATGTVAELTVKNQVTGVTLRYFGLKLDQGGSYALTGAGLDTLSNGSRINAVGTVAGNLFNVTVFSSVASADSATRATPQAKTKKTISGTLAVYHKDFFDQGRGEYGLAVREASGKPTQLNVAVIPDSLEIGMLISVDGTPAADGSSLDVSSITILAPPPAGLNDVAATPVTNNVLVLPIKFTDSPGDPFTVAQINTEFQTRVGPYYQEVSYGQQLLNITVATSGGGWLNASVATPANCDWQTVGNLADAAATAAGYNINGYQNRYYVMTPNGACGWAGLAYVGFGRAWSNGYNALWVYGHELGHNFGLWHSGSLSCSGQVIGGSCGVNEYGDPFDAMGNIYPGHFNSMQKSVLGWISASSVKTHTAGSATYTLSPLETSGQSTYAVKIPAASNRTYWIEYRQPVGVDSGIASSNGAQIRVAAPFQFPCTNCGGDDTQILDMTLGTPGSFGDAALLLNQTYNDATYNISVTVTGVTTGPAGTLTLSITAPGGGAATTTTLASSLNPSTVGASVTFTASVTGAAPTGSVNFTGGGATISGCGAVALAGAGNTRTAACSTAALSAATHIIVAAYSGDGANTVSSSSPLSQVVKAVAATSVSSSANPSTVGTGVTFTASVTGIAPTGTVAFTADSTTISGCGAVALTGAGNTRTAPCATSSLSAGTHSIVASYGGDAGNTSSSGAPLSQVDNPSVGVPPPPTAVTATPGNARAIVSFTPSASDGGSPILNYTTTSSPNNITGSCSAPCTSINVIGLTNGTAYTFTVTATNAIGTGAASAPSNSVTVGPRQRDNDGDGKGDLLWRNGPTGQTAEWLMNGLSPSSSGIISADSNWTVTHTGDLNGDGKTDLIWRNTSTGQTAGWLMNGLSAPTAAILYGDPNWAVINTGDFNGDGKADLVWRNTATGQTAIWLMNGLSATSSALIYGDPNWVVTQVGDFNGDGKADLLWRNTATGQTAIWLMNGLVSTSSAVIYSDPNWVVLQAADFDGDGKTDLLWRNTATGQTAIWLMNGLVPTSSALIYSDPNWMVTQTGDFNGDGKADLLWRNTSTGQTAIWLMNGLAPLSSAVIYSDPTWAVSYVSDLSGDGKSDLVWRNAVSGQTAGWLMNGLSPTSSAILYSDPNWAVLVPGGGP